MSNQPNSPEPSPQTAIELKSKPTAAPIVWAVLIGTAWFIALAGITLMLYHFARNALIDEIRAGLARTAKIAAKQVDGDSHRQFRAAEQESSAEYQAAIKPLREIMWADPQIAFVYSAVLIDGKVHFILDATPPPAAGEKDESVAVMEEYQDPPPDLSRALKQQELVVASEPYTDEWGTFISAYQPLLDSGGAFEGVIGVDLKTTDYEKRLRPIRHASLIAIALAAIIALTAASAVYFVRRSDRNVKALGRQLKIVNALLNVSRALGSNIGIKNLLPVIVHKTTEVMGVERTSLFLYDRERHTLKGHVLEGMDDEALRFSDARGVVGRVARSGTIANIPTPQLDPDFDPGFDRQSGFQTRNMLVVPVLDSKQRVMAVLQALNRSVKGGFDADDEAIMTALAAQVQVALEREQMAHSAAEKQKLDDTLKLAQTIQMGMLSKRFPESTEARLQLHAELYPAKTVGGDFYDFFWLADGRLGLVMADVSGKGIPAALLMAKAMTLIRAFATLDVPPAEVLRMANDDLAHDNDAAMFVTVFLAVLDPNSGVLRYANGGHNHSLLVRQGAIELLDKADAVPLGTMEGMEFSETELQLLPGDLLYMHTDGVNEAMDLRFQEFGDPRMHEVVLAQKDAGPIELTREMLEAVRAHAKDAEQSDDITVMALRYRGVA
jgi:sigma-B regulation protein RsbU (phosphoserine phosphatase)